MKKNIKFYSLISILILKSWCLYAQAPNDAILMEAKQACILIDYNLSNFDHYWEGNKIRANQTIATVHRNAVMPIVAIGLLDRLNVYVGVPFIKTFSEDPNGGKFNGVSGVQDLTIALKYKFLEKKVGKGNLNAFATAGFSTPIANYLPDYMPYSLGLGAPELTYRAIAQYNINKKLYVRGAGTYLWRGYAEAEREYYYNDGSFYTPWMDVPNAITSEAVLGTWVLGQKLQLEVSYFRSRSLNGDDIRSYNSPQPTNKVNSDRIGAFGHYYFSKINGLGLIAYHNRVLNGKNAPQMNTSGLGITYFFNFLKNNKNEK